MKLNAFKCYDYQSHFYNVSCFLKPIRQTMGVLNFHAVMKSALPDVWDEVIMFYKFGTIYRQYLLHWDIDVCKILRGKGTNVLEQMFTVHWKDHFPSLGICPLRDAFDWKSNSTASSIIFQNFTRFPDGDYKIVHRLHTKENVTLITNEVKYSVRSKRGGIKMSMLEMG